MNSFLTASPSLSVMQARLSRPRTALLAAWYGGSREGAEDVQIWSARQENGKWSAPTVLASGMPNGEWHAADLESRIVPLSKRSADAVL